MLTDEKLFEIKKSRAAGDGVDGKEWAKTVAGYEHVSAVSATADGFHGEAPWFHGWAVREAFVAGAEWQESRGNTRPAPADSGWRDGAEAMRSMILDNLTQYEYSGSASEVASGILNSIATMPLPPAPKEA